MNKWYVLHVLSGAEIDVKSVVEQNQIKGLVPRRTVRERYNGEWKNVIRNLIPGYVFVNCRMTDEGYYTLQKVPNVIDILRGASEQPEPISEDEMKSIFTLTSESDLIGISDVYENDETITVVSGPLQGFEGKILKIDKRRFRAKVALTVAGTEKTVELGINMVQKMQLN